MKYINLGNCVVELHDDNRTVVKFGNGEVEFSPEDDPIYRAKANALGYSWDFNKFSRDNAVAHILLAQWLGMPHSPALMCRAGGGSYALHTAEVAAVYSLQRYAHAAGIDLVTLLEQRGSTFELLKGEEGDKEAKL